MPVKPPSSSHERLRIAVLLDHLNLFSGGYEAQLRNALHAHCLATGHHLFLLYGGLLEPPQPMSVPDNAFYALLRPDSVDGIIIVSSLLSAYCGPDGVSRLVERYTQAKLCSIGVALPGVPSIVLDNRPGMETVVEHLVRDHGCRRLAFLEGTPQNPEADVRLHAYRAVLERNGIAFDPRLVARGYFRTNLARAAMEEIFASGVTFDGVVAANDEMATGAIEVLRKHGRRVPQDLPVTGFDDILLARLADPPLTTVAQPFDLVVDQAIRLLTEQLAGRQVPDCTSVAAKFICRQSCGCGNEGYRRNLESVPAVHPDGSQSLDERIESLRPELAGVLRTGWSDGSAPASRLIDGLRQEASGQTRSLQRAVVELLEDVRDDSERHQMLQSAIGYLRAELRAYLTLQIEDAFYESLNLVALSNTTTQLQHRLQLDENYLRLLTLGEQASIALDLASLQDTLIKGLPNAGVRTAYLSCISEVEPGKLVPTMCLLDGRLLELDEANRQSSSLLPPRVFELDRRDTFLVFPLAFDSELLGVIAFSYSEGTNAYAAFRNEIATALKSIRLRQELVQETMLRERSVQERLATSKRMQALRVLAGGVAHDLNNALGPLVALPDVILHDLDHLESGEDVLADVKADVESIQSAALRAAQTIRDLLTLSRQGRTTKTPLDLNPTVMGCLRDGPLRLTKETNRQIRMTVDLAPENITIHASEVQLARAIANLVGNAVEAITGAGEVRVQTALRQLDKPHAGYETIPPGDYAVVTVSDNGIGIPAQDLPRVFEPFFSKKQAGANSGTGLGLAIVHGVVKEHDGFVDVASTVGQGTTFSLYFPCFRGGMQQKAESKAAPAGNARILVVDDDPIQLRTCRRVLTHLGHRVDTMESGQKAYDSLVEAAGYGASPYDLVILDVILDEPLDGIEILEKIQQLFPTQKAILASGHAPNERAKRAVHKGLPWLVKPYGTEVLAQAVEATLRPIPRLVS